MLNQTSKHEISPTWIRNETNMQDAIGSDQMSLYPSLTTYPDALMRNNTDYRGRISEYTRSGIEADSTQQRRE